MSLSIKTQIFEQLATNLADNISTANGDVFTPQQVFRYLPNAASLKSQATLPCIYVWVGKEVKSDTDCIGYIRNRLDLHVAFFEDVVQNAYQKGMEMAADIEDELVSINAYNIASSVVEVVPKNTQIIVAQTQEFFAGGKSVFEVQYYTDRGNTRTNS